MKLKKISRDETYSSKCGSFTFHTGSALRLKLQSRNFYIFYAFELILCRMVELCTSNNGVFFLFDFNELFFLWENNVP